LEHIRLPEVHFDTTPPVITLDSSQTTYAVDATVPLGCTAVDNVDPSVDCTYTGTVDSSIEGTYDITYSSTDASANTATLIVTYTIGTVVDPLNIDMDTYYDSAEGLSGAALEAALTLIINNGFDGVTYGESRYLLDDTDADPAIAGNVILVYLQVSEVGEWYCPTTNDCNWNREHVWPQSLLGVSADNGTTNVASDLHNLKPADSGENSSRSNKFFDNLTTTDAYEPPDEVKCDIARILFYMTVMYNESSGYDLELIDITSGEPNIYQMGNLATLLAWHELDPVDAFEEARNEAIFGYQHNRNPFIDYPHLVELIWGNHSYYTTN